MNNIETIKKQMNKITAETNLPLHYKGDVEIDMAMLNDWKGHKLVWLLRTHGTALVPMCVGATPVHITYWLTQENSKDVRAFIIHTQRGVIEEVTHKQAQDSIALAPHISGLSRKEDIEKRVESVINSGCEKGLWGMFDAPMSMNKIGGMQEWLTYFRDHKNQPMVDFMKKAIKYHKCNRPTAMVNGIPVSKNTMLDADVVF